MCMSDWYIRINCTPRLPLHVMYYVARRLEKKWKDTGKGHLGILVNSITPKQGILVNSHGYGYFPQDTGYCQSQIWCEYYDVHALSAL